MEKKIGVYICSGCGIGEAINVDQLADVAKENNVALCKSHSVLCSKEGVELIKGDIAQEGVNTIVIAACSPRVMYDVFNFEGCIVDRVNIREQVAWCQPPGDENTQMMAEDYLKMGLAKVNRMELPESYKPDTEMSKEILVVGGGIAGLSAAISAAEAGYQVTLVEKEESLGGFQKNVKEVATFPYKGVKSNELDELIKKVTENSNITVYTSSKIVSTAGGPGIFDVTISQNGSTIEKRFGAIVLASGWVPYDPKNLNPKLGYGLPNVITNVQFEEMLSKEGWIKRPKDGGSVKNAAFLLCAGSRDPSHLPYCSTVCCLVSLKQALEIKKQNPDANVFIVYKEMRTPGQAEDLYRKAQEEEVIFVRCQDPEVKTGLNGLTVKGFEDLVGEEVVIEDLDLVVLATGMVPTTAFGQNVIAGEKKEGEEEPVPTDIILNSDILNLQYRQGPEVPILKYGFPDSHFICFPYESRRTGIYPAGCVRRPQGIASAIEDGTGAAMKAIQCIEMVHKGMAVHPRAGDLSFPEFFMQRCTQCKRCTVECPFGAINEDEKANPLPQPTRCRRCGVCMGACPERIISFKNYSVGMIGDMIKAISVPDEYEEKPRIVVLACENDAYPALDMAGVRRMKYNPWVRIVPLRCLGSMNLIWIADALSSGIDGVILLGCKYGEDYQCHFIRGSELANIRLSKIKETLDRLALESDRVRFETVSISDYDKLPQILDDFAAKIQEIGPNPYKGF